MKAVNLKSGERVNFWLISQSNPQPNWIQQAFSAGKLAWNGKTALRFAKAPGSDDATFAVGDVLVEKDANNLVDLSASKFSQDYQLV